MRMRLRDPRCRCWSGTQRQPGNKTASQQADAFAALNPDAINEALFPTVESPGAPCSTFPLCDREFVFLENTHACLWGHPEHKHLPWALQLQTKRKIRCFPQVTEVQEALWLIDGWPLFFNDPTSVTLCRSGTGWIPMDFQTNSRLYGSQETTLVFRLRLFPRL